MKLFALSEANALIPRIRPRLERLQKLHVYLVKQKTAAREAAAKAPSGGGGLADGGLYAGRLLEFGEISRALDGLGIQVKDYGSGLIDFPAWREDRVVFLCWKLGEGDEIAWWHEIEAGFAGRRPL
jgi:hypothetical protein